jgi:hypothetical protein
MSHFGYLDPTLLPRLQPCVTCGSQVTHRATQILGRQDPWWSAEPHTAPCGAPCIGGGVRPIPQDERPPGTSGIGHTHRKDKCGTPGCKGGVIP